MNIFQIKKKKKKQKEDKSLSGFALTKSELPREIPSEIRIEGSGSCLILR